MIAWTPVGTTVAASFLACLVECVEALTVVLAVGATRGWRCALLGVAAALLGLTLLIAFFGRSLGGIPLYLVQLIVGTLVLLFGMRWLRKAVLRAAGIIALHDEAEEYARQSAQLRQLAPARTLNWDAAAFLSSFKIVTLEGIEVVFIVIAMSAGSGSLWPAALGAGAALAAVLLLGLWLHRPLQKIPENSLKFVVGVLLAGFGTLWVGEGLGLRWPAGDLAAPLLMSLYFLWACALVAMLRRRRAPRRSRDRVVSAEEPAAILRNVGHELWALFIDDLGLALGILAWVAFSWFAPRLIAVPMMARSALCFIGFALLLGASARRATMPAGTSEIA